MKLSLTGLHLESDPKLKAYADKKVKKFIHYDPRITDIKVRLFLEKSHRNESHDCICELTVHVPGKILEIVDKEKDHMAAIDKAFDRMKRAIVKHKEKEISEEHKRGIVAKLLGRFRR